MMIEPANGNGLIDCSNPLGLLIKLDLGYPDDPADTIRLA